MQRCTPDLEELVQPFADELHTGVDPGGSCMECTAQLHGKGSLNHVQRIVKGQETVLEGGRANGLAIPPHSSCQLC